MTPDYTQTENLPFEDKTQTTLSYTSQSCINIHGHLNETDLLLYCLVVIVTKEEWLGKTLLNYL